MEFSVTSILSCDPVWSKETEPLSSDAGPDSPHDPQEPMQNPVDQISW